MVVTMEQNEAVSHLDKGRFCRTDGYRGAPDSGASVRQGIRANARRSGCTRAIRNFYFRTADGREPAVSLMHIRPSRATSAGWKPRPPISWAKPTTKGDEMPLLIWDAAQSLYRLTVEKSWGPANTLGEKGPEGLEMYVWDCWRRRRRFKNNTSIELHFAKSGSNPRSDQNLSSQKPAWCDVTQREPRQRPAGAPPPPVGAPRR